jgi:hypothetical protein
LTQPNTESSSASRIAGSSTVTSSCRRLRTLTQQHDIPYGCRD